MTKNIQITVSDDEAERIRQDWLAQIADAEAKATDARAAQERLRSDMEAAKSRAIALGDQAKELRKRYKDTFGQPTT